MYVPLASRAGAHIETQAPWVELWPPSVLMAHDLRSNQGRHISSFLCCKCLFQPAGRICCVAACTHFSVSWVFFAFLFHQHAIISSGGRILFALASSFEPTHGRKMKKEFEILIHLEI
jgi:hypothetical protein